MNKFEEKLKALLGERETIIQELGELKQAFDIRQQRLLEIAGSIKTLQELMSDEETETDEDTADTNKK
jgi:hypothetical protein